MTAVNDLPDKLRDVGKRILLQLDGSLLRRQLLEQWPAEGINSPSRRGSPEALADSGWLLASLPVGMGGVHFGSGGEASQHSVEAFVSLARVDPALGDRFASHVRALRLIELYGNASQRLQVQQCVCDGRELAVIDPSLHSDVKLSQDGSTLSGQLDTPLPDASSQLWIVEAQWQGTGQWCLVDACAVGAHARGSFNQSVMFSRLGEPDNLQREPWIHGGAWRAAAIQLGLIHELLFQFQLFCPMSSELFDRVGELYHRVIARGISARRVIDDAAAFVEAESGEKQPDEALVLSGVASFVTDDAVSLAIRFADTVASESPADATDTFTSASQQLRLRPGGSLAPRVQSAFGRVLMLPGSAVTLDRLRERSAV